ncbi:MAG: gamma-glutamyl-gamma-aminobutyrate hydrolase family protein [Acidobacteriaceae bacterium]
MTAPRPLIAIPEPTSTDQAYNRRSLPQYIRSVEAAGGIGVPIPLDAPASQQEVLLLSCAAILLPGSPADLDPARYGQERREETAAKDSPREAADDLLLHDAFTQSKPILGICYGLQSLNVWSGGTLIQHVPFANGSVVDHAPGRTVERAHPLQVVPGSRLSSILRARELEGGELEGGGKDLFVNSSHHQAIAKPGNLLNMAGTSPADGIIEALEGVDSGQFVLGVQWHPERTYESSSASRALFAAFLEAARLWKPCTL